MVFNTSFRALVLNASYEPLQIVNWQKAILLWFSGKVEVLDKHDAFVRSVREKLAIPSVIRLRTYVAIRGRNKIRFSRDNVLLRDDYSCQYCGRVQPPRELTLDHLLPISRGGKKSWKNIVTACRRCNQKKGNRTPEEAHMRLLKKPQLPSWLPSRRFEIDLELVPESWRIYLPPLKKSCIGV
jgi:5-methylcytosine-specific restriction endonuclease McrA